MVLYSVWACFYGCSVPPGYNNIYLEEGMLSSNIYITAVKFTCSCPGYMYTFKFLNYMVMKVQQVSPSSLKYYTEVSNLRDRCHSKIAVSFSVRFPQIHVKLKWVSG